MSLRFGDGAALLSATLFVAACLALLQPHLARAEPGQPPAAPSGTPRPRAAPLPSAHLPPGASADDGGPSPVVFPPQRLALRFDHRRHSGERQIACVRCHPAATTSQSASDRVLPEPGVCDSCHGASHAARGPRPRSDPAGETAPPPRCSLCHTGPGADAEPPAIERSVLPAPRLHFSHAAHFAKNIGCGQCHGDLRRVEHATRDQLPRMRGCFGCHQQAGAARGGARGECRVCHLALPGAGIQARLDTGKLLPPRWLRGADHGPGWIERHAGVAAADSAFCGNCHTHAECIECHDGRVRPRSIHPNDWLSMHGVSAQQAASRCTSCHRQQSFCLTCHQRSGVALSGPPAATATRGRFHPDKAVWTDGPGGMGHHGAAARERLQTCTSCHTERDCLLCHAAASRGGPAGLGPSSMGRSPHPPGFDQGCRAFFDRNPRACLACHAPDDAELSRCR